jgi:hypothetical protein
MTSDEARFIINALFATATVGTLIYFFLEFRDERRRQRKDNLRRKASLEPGPRPWVKRESYDQPKTKRRRRRKPKRELHTSRSISVPFHEDDSDHFVETSTSDSNFFTSSNDLKTNGNN